MAKKKNFFINVYEIGPSADESPLVRSGPAKDRSQMLGAGLPSPTRKREHAVCRKCKGSGRSGLFKCATCNGRRYVLAAS